MSERRVAPSVIHGDMEHPMPTTVTVVTYNVLAQAYVRPERYPYTAPEDLEPDVRRRRLLERIAAFDADVLCLQEVEPDIHEAIAERLGEDYQGVHAPRHRRPDGCSVFARRRPLTWEHHEVLHYAAHDPGDDQLALITMLRHGETTLAIASTHLRWQPDHVSPDAHIGRRQLSELLDRRERHPDPSTRWILAGDLNAISQSVVIREAEDRGLVLSCRSQRPWDTCNANRRRRKLDYLLIEPGALRPHPRPLRSLQRDTPLPSPVEPSDHLPVVVDYHLGSSADR